MKSYFIITMVLFVYASMFMAVVELWPEIASTGETNKRETYEWQSN